MTSLAVFVNEDGEHGDVVPIIQDEGRSLSLRKRMDIASEHTAAETVFVNSATENDISFIHPQGELPFVGTAAVGAAWHLAKLHKAPISNFTSSGGLIETFESSGITWVEAALDSMPAWNLVQLESPDLVEALSPTDQKETLHTLFWAWIDESKQTIRARTFAPDWDILEAEANGSGAILLATQLGREITLSHGKGSIIYAKPKNKTHVLLGGRVKRL